MDAIRSKPIQWNTPAPASAATPLVEAGRTALRGSANPITARSTYLGPTPPSERVSVTVVLSRSRELQLPQQSFQPLSTEDLKRCAPAAEQTGAVQQFAAQFGLAAAAADPVTRTVRLDGTAAQLEKAFGVKLGRYRTPEGQEFRGFSGDIRLPQSMTKGVDAILGLDNPPLAKPRNRVLDTRNPFGETFDPADVAALYNFPKNTTGAGQKIAIIELGGGYRDADLKAYFKAQGVAQPRVRAVSVDGAQNKPTGNPASEDTEVALDIDVVGAVAPGAEIVVYFGPNSDQGFLDALNAAVHDSSGRPTAVSISWGAPEKDWTPQAMKSFDSAMKDAAALGVNVYCASGDNGSSDGVNDGKDHADFPASSPHGVGCGGTKLKSKNGQISSEKVWNSWFGGAAGGGASSFWPKPDFQKQINVPKPGGRGVPDIAGDADPASGYHILVDGAWKTVGGTSAVAPLLAALNARLAQGLGAPVPFLPPLIYKDAFKPAFHDITKGSNGTFKAGPGWDAASGLGSPDGEALLAALKTEKASQQA